MLSDVDSRSGNIEPVGARGTELCDSAFFLYPYQVRTEFCEAGQLHLCLFEFGEYPGDHLHRSQR